MTTYQDQQKEWAKRRKRVVQLFRRNMSYIDIGRQLDPPVSPQRVRAILLAEGELQPGVRRGA